MKVLLLEKHIKAGGVYTHLKFLTQGLQEKGVEFILITEGDHENEELIKSFSCKVIKLSKKSNTFFNFLQWIQIVFRTIRNCKVDVIHSHHRYVMIVSSVVQLFLNKFKNIWTIHQFNTDKKWFFLLKWPSCRIVSPSFALNKYLVDYYGIKESCVRVIHNSIISNYITTESIRKSTPIITYIGRLEESKGIKLFIEMISSINIHSQSFKIYGDGPYKDQMIVYLQNIGKSEIYKGVVDNIEEVIDEVDIVVIPSFSENLSMVGVESLCHGKAIVASNVGGNPEIVEDGKNGYLFESGNSIDLTRKVEDILDSQKLAVFKKESRRLYEKQFDSERILGLYVKLYEETD